MIMRMLLVVSVTLSTSIATAETAHTVSVIKSAPATKVARAEEVREGCGLTDVSGSSLYDHKTIAAASKNATVKTVWSWCVKPDLEIRVWSTCDGAGDSTTCLLYAARVGARGKLGTIVRVPAGWSEPKVESIDSSDAPKLWKGAGLKVSFEAGRGNAVMGAYVIKNQVKFTKPEWDDK